MEVTELFAKQALNKNKTYFTPYSHDLNVYRGCSHRCCYCYAIYSHKFLNNKNFYDDVYYKINIAEKLDNELTKKKIKPKLIGIGTVCDSYQPLEKKLKLTKRCLEVCLKHKTPIYLSTKSDLILRDIDILKKLSEATPIALCVSITTLNEQIAKKIEPAVISSQQRFNVLKKLKENTNALVGVHLMPIIPYLTDDFINLKRIFLLAKENNLDFVICDCLNLIGETKKSFLNFILINFPEIYEKLKNLYSNQNKLKNYIQNLKNNIKLIKKELNFKNKYILNFLNEEEKFLQLSLFDD